MLSLPVLRNTSCQKIGKALLATQVDLIELSLRGTSLIERKVKRKRSNYYIENITDKFGGETWYREKFHGWNCQAYQNYKSRVKFDRDWYDIN